MTHCLLHVIPIRAVYAPLCRGVNGCRIILSMTHDSSCSIFPAGSTHLPVIWLCHSKKWCESCIISVRFHYPCFVEIGRCSFCLSTRSGARYLSTNDRPTTYLLPKLLSYLIIYHMLYHPLLQKLRLYPYFVSRVGSGRLQLTPYRSCICAFTSADREADT